MKLSFLFILTFFLIDFANSQNCPSGNLSKNGHCIKMSYANATEATAAQTMMTSFVVTGSTTGANGSYTFDEICPNGTDVIFALNGATCNCSGSFNQGEDGTFTFSNPSMICEYDANGTLPVIFGKISLEQDDGVIIHWTTTSEMNNDYFSVERSKDGKLWEELGLVNSSGNSEIENAYSFWDANPLSGISHYRIKQVDFNQAFTFSKIISYVNPVSNSQIKVDRISDALIIENYDHHKRVSITSSNGKTIFTGSIVEGHNNLSIDEFKFKTGIYIVSLSGEITQSFKVVLF